MRISLLSGCFAAVLAAATAAHDIDVAGMDRSVRPRRQLLRLRQRRLARADTDSARPRQCRRLGGSRRTRRHEHTRDRRARRRVQRAGRLRRAQGRRHYASYTDEASIEAKGLTPIEPLLKKIAAIGDRRALSESVCGSLRADVDALNSTNFYTPHLFGLWFTQDLNDPSRNAAYLLQGGLGMPDREYT